MSLDELIRDKLVITENSQTRARPTYDSSIFLEAHNGRIKLIQLAGEDLGTPEGAAKYTQITGHDSVGLSPKKLGRNVDARIKGIGEDLELWIEEHLVPIVGELPEETQQSLALSYLSSTKATDENFERARKRVVSNIKNLQLAEMANKSIDRQGKDSTGYVSHLMTQETPLMARYLSHFEKETVIIEIEDSEEAISQTIKDYGIGEFVKGAYSHIISMGDTNRAKEVIEIVKGYYLKSLKDQESS